MDEELRAELIRRMEADAAAVRGFLESADTYRDAFMLRPEAHSTIPWPYVALDWSPEATAPDEVRKVLATVTTRIGCGRWLRSMVGLAGL